MIRSLDRIGSIGALLCAAAAPCYFPLFAAIAAASVSLCSPDLSRQCFIYFKVLPCSRLSV
jgi:hypothetical protein